MSEKLDKLIAEDNNLLYCPAIKYWINLYKAGKLSPENIRLVVEMITCLDDLWEKQPYYCE